MNAARPLLMNIPLCCAVLLAARAAWGAEPVDEATRKLLATFRREFVELTPGEGDFP